jgi:hypothetical protein
MGQKKPTIFNHSIKNNIYSEEKNYFIDAHTLINKIYNVFFLYRKSIMFIHFSKHILYICACSLSDSLEKLAHKKNSKCPSQVPTLHFQTQYFFS